uniref:Fibrinogen C-terminal domain-containing protein n=1 Tax=Branchiostoma floridae TaxID=7739 RepID=C3YH85_BRAFL|eukprot:XP_002604310.1 hypothetical protein BRAFLDRAFT_88600 [Branchiostoma floridae]
MSKVVLLALLALLQQGGAANVKNLPEIVHHETAGGDGEVTGQITLHCPVQPAPSCPALDHLLLYLNAQLSLEGQVDQLKNRTDRLDGQLQQLAQQELAQLQGTLQQLEATNQQHATSLQQLETTNQQQATSLQQLETTNQQQASSLQLLEGTLQHQSATLQEYATYLQQLQDKVTGLRTCKELLNNGHNTSGVYMIYPEGGGISPIHVYCDMDTDEGGWTVIDDIIFI